MADTAPPLSLSVAPDRVVRDPGALKWGTVSTVKGSLSEIARFAAYHLDLGAAKVNLYLDTPDYRTAEILSAHPQVSVTVCDARYWQGKSDKARQTHQLRQAFNATRCYRRTRLHWLAHIDLDEYLIPPTGDLAAHLAAAPEDCAYVRLRPAELLAQPDPFTGPAHFKLTRKAAGQKKAALAKIYPTFGPYVPEGFISYTGGKNIARAGLPDIRFGIHALMHKGDRVRNGHMLPDGFVGHAHAPDWATFHRHFGFRMDHGSYRKKAEDGMRLRDVLDMVRESEGEAGLRAFFEEMCVASPRLLARLSAHGMLLTASLDLDARVARVFGKLPEA